MMCWAQPGLKRSGKVHVDQGEVWDHVDGVFEWKAASPTDAYHAM